MPDDQTGPLTERALFEAIERAILGSPRSLTRLEAVEAAGVPLDSAVSLWRSLGFPGTDDDEPLFIDADVEALRMVAWLVETGFVDPLFQVTLARSMGLSFSRLAEWEVAELAAAAMTGTMLSDPSRIEEMIASLIPVVEDLQNYVWRRHLAAAAGRILLRPDAGDSEAGTPMVVGFVDIVGFTRRSRGLTADQLAHLVEVFEDVTSSVVTEHGGRVVKTIGDEVLFVADTPADGARIALALVEAEERDEDYPEVRVGAAYGQVLSRMGDVFGSVVNIAARLTSLARPGRILLDRELAAVLEDDEEFRVKRGRTASVKGYSRLDTFGLKRPRAEEHEHSRHDRADDEHEREQPERQHEHGHRHGRRHR